jgi:hypothetical protein
MLMGTARWQKERTDGEAIARLESEFEVKRILAHNELTELEASVEALQRTVQERHLSLHTMLSVEAARKHGDQLTHSGVIQLRHGKQINLPNHETLRPNKGPRFGCCA